MKNKLDNEKIRKRIKKEIENKKLEVEFNELYKILKIDRNISPWSMQNTLETRFYELEKEIGEIEDAIKNKDYNNLMEEIGDSILDLIFLSIITEELTDKNIGYILHNTIKKIKRRKPWILSNERLTVRQELERWNKAKEKEKNSRGLG